MEGTQPPSFAELLRRYRQRDGLTREGLAERAGLSARAISDLERGEHLRPQRHTLEQLAAARTATARLLTACPDYSYPY